ncbi:MAG: hypothetical protein KatS3mg082_0874 [Nitrospiraceae bacterium]|nr:MAG: hypothetical protein KatS3mg082_0874 [Nitrospiraceae bacterium]
MEKAAIFGITSAIKGEGKTTTAMNLGYTMAKDLGKRTLVIDCDFKCPALHKIAGVNSESGLADMLNREQPGSKRAWCRSGELPIWIIPGGHTNGHPITLSKAHQLSSIIAQVREQFDYIILDAPPILSGRRHERVGENGRCSGPRGSRGEDSERSGTVRRQSIEKRTPCRCGTERSDARGNSILFPGTITRFVKLLRNEYEIRRTSGNARHECLGDFRENFHNRPSAFRR